MKLNIAYPANGTQQTITIEEEQRYRGFFEKRIAQEVNADFMGDEWKGYIFKITGGSDKEGYAMKQGVMTTKRVKLLLGKGDSGFHAIRSGERRRKSVHGCIIDNSLSVLNVIIVKRGVGEIPGLTDTVIPRRLGPKRAGKIRKMFNLGKNDDVSKYVLHRTVKYKNPEKQAKVTKIKTKSPKIQRLVTPVTLQRRRKIKACIKKRRERRVSDAKEYQKVVHEYNKQKLRA
ncbi:hypothetical protein HZS_984 [Henneguya salminicola]|uniref:40S ribosomal protein S6 n=1 Tax=Henneguya salminicola TaxID=69463 RepID=A0A6G3MHE1_HENSL|nr:hypothetical protein HZS_984 [Henneguya salminicola]